MLKAFMRRGMIRLLLVTILQVLLIVGVTITAVITVINGMRVVYIPLEIVVTVVVPILARNGLLIVGVGRKRVGKR
jgi:hypothetical protein